MTTYTSKTAYLISRLEKMAIKYASNGARYKYECTHKHISDLKSSKLGGPVFAKIYMNTYIEAKVIGIDWDNEWLPLGIPKKPIPSRTQHSDTLQYDKMISYLCSRISEIRTTCQLSTHEHNAAQNFFWYLKDQRHSEMYRTALWIGGICKKYGVTWAPGMSLDELKDYLELNFPFSEIKCGDGLIEVRSGNPCAEITLPVESPKQEPNRMLLI